MKIFGFEITKQKTEIVEDQIPEIKTAIPDTKGPATIKSVTDPVMRYSTNKFTGRGSFMPAEYDLSEMGRVEDTDSYVQQAFNKKIALMFKEGWDIVGPNRRIIRYIKARLAQIAAASGVPTKLLMREVGTGLIKKSNAFLVKVRKTEASGGKTRKLPGSRKVLQPVAGYFVAPPETMEYESSNNKITKWRQRMPDGLYKEHMPEDVIHFFYSRKEGFIFGTPTLVPVIDDIRALRKIEENIELLVYQHLFPLFQYIVGTKEAPAGITETGEREIDVVKREIQYMPTEGGIVTPERHEVKAIGAEGRALRAEGYLEHFKKRVFAGLGVSAVDMGEVETANRATADNMSRNLIDSVKDFQQVTEILVNEFIIKELLLESTFGPEVLNEENVCGIVFKEIDVDAQIKKENHAADLFSKNLITWDEARNRMGHEPILMPTPEEIQAGTDTPDKYPEWNKTFWKIFELPKLLIQAIDEPWSPAAKAAARDNSLPVTETDNEEATKQIVENEKAKRPPPTKTATRDNYLASVFSQTKFDILSMVSDQDRFDDDWVGAIIRTQIGTSVTNLVADQMLAFYRGYSNIHSVSTAEYMTDASVARRLFTDRIEKYVSRLVEDVVKAIKRNTSTEMTKTELSFKIKNVFDVFKYRTEFIEDVEIKKARMLGVAVAMRREGAERISIAASGPEPCDSCLAAQGELELQYATIDNIPPFHASCNCTLSRIEASVPLADNMSGNADDPSGVLPDSEFAKCPKCGKTANRTKNTPDIYNCFACKYSFRLVSDEEVKEVEDGKKFDRCVSHLKQSLKKSHPGWSDDKVESVAYATCTKNLKGK